MSSTIIVTREGGTRAGRRPGKCRAKSPQARPKDRMVRSLSSAPRSVPRPSRDSDRYAATARRPARASRADRAHRSRSQGAAVVAARRPGVGARPSAARPGRPRRRARRRVRGRRPLGRHDRRSAGRSSQLDGGDLPLRRQSVACAACSIARPLVRSPRPREGYRARDRAGPADGDRGAGRPDAAPARDGEPGRERPALHAAQRPHRAVGARAAGRSRDRGLERRPADPGARSRAHLPQVRARRSEPPRSGSAGLGLYFCKRAVEAHGGAIAVVETADWPTSFRITLP